MFFDDLLQIKDIAAKSGTSIFIVPEPEQIEIKKALVLEPTTKKTITIDEVREKIPLFQTRETQDFFVVIRPVEKLGLEAANALLKTLEEPPEKVHFVLLTRDLSSVLPTIKSRAAIYFLRLKPDFTGDLKADPKIQALAKRLIVAKNTDLIPLAEEITKKKEGAREYALTILETAVEMLYKSYFKTKKPVFIEKIPRFCETYENIVRNGHVKLHLVADLL